MPTFQNQTIIVPFDFSNPSENALNQVRQWADESNTIHMIYVVTPTPTIIEINPPVALPPNFDLTAQELLFGKMQKEFEFANVKHHCVIGDPGSQIVKLAKSKKADVIIMPSHGRSGVSRFFLGSVAERVLRLSECPVFILRGDKFENDNVAVDETATESAST